MIEIKKTYAEMLDFRRKLRRTRDNFPNLAFRPKRNSYILYIYDEPFLYYCLVKPGTTEHADFELSRMQHCNQIDRPEGKKILSHNFASSATWTQAPNKNIFMMAPATGKELYLHSLDGKLDKDSVFAAGQSFNVVTWIGLAGTCPAYVPGTITDHTGPGWIEITDMTGQGYETWAFFDGVIPYPQCVAKHYKHLSLESMTNKSDIDSSDSTFYKVGFPFDKALIDVFLKSSSNDRIEIYFDNNGSIGTEVNSPNNVFSSLELRGAEYPEW